MIAAGPDTRRDDRQVAALLNPRPPVAVAVPALVALLFLVIPLGALVLRAPWGSLGELLGSESARQALLLSLWTASVTTVIAILIGVPLAWVLARTHFVGRSWARSFVILPLVLPPVVGGVALLLVFGRTGILGTGLDEVFGVTIPFTPFAVILAQLFVSLPFLIIAVEGGLLSSDGSREEAAAVLGASSSRVFWTVTLPMARSSILAGAVLCWARALGEFGATVTFAGSLPGRTQTMPIEIYYEMQREPAAAVALSLVLVLVCLVVLIGLRRTWSGRVLSP